MKNPNPNPRSDPQGKRKKRDERRYLSGPRHHCATAGSPEVVETTVPARRRGTGSMTPRTPPGAPLSACARDPKGTTEVPLDGAARGFGRTHAPARGAIVAPPATIPTLGSGPGKQGKEEKGPQHPLSHGRARGRRRGWRAAAAPPPPAPPRAATAGDSDRNHSGRRL